MLIAGAGEGGRLVLREIVRNRELRLVPVGFLDDDPGKRSLRIDGVRVRGNTEGDLPRILDEVRARRSDHRDPLRARLDARAVVRACRERGDPRAHAADRVRAARSGPGHPATLARQVREVRVEDVLGREPVHMELERVGRLPRRGRPCSSPAPAARSAPSCAARSRASSRAGSCSLDHAEDNLFAIQRELEDERHVPPSMLAAVLADCKEEERMREVFAEHRPDRRVPRRRLQARRA